MHPRQNLREFGFQLVVIVKPHEKQTFQESFFLFFDDMDGNKEMME